MSERETLTIEKSALNLNVYEKLEDYLKLNEVEKKENVFLKNLGSRTTYIISPPHRDNHINKMTL